MKATITAVALLGMMAGIGQAQAGCVSGAAVGGVAGHFAGHHAVLGALAGCAIGHHQAKKREMPQQRSEPSPDSQKSM